MVVPFLHVLPDQFEKDMDKGDYDEGFGERRLRRRRVRVGRGAQVLGVGLHSLPARPRHVPDQVRHQLDQFLLVLITRGNHWLDRCTNLVWGVNLLVRLTTQCCTFV